MKKTLIKTLFVILLIISYVYVCSAISIPKNIVVFEGENLNLKIATGLEEPINNTKDKPEKEYKMSDSFDSKGNFK